MNIEKSIKGIQLSDAVWVCQAHARDFNRPTKETDAEGPFCKTHTEPGTSALTLLLSR